MLARWSVVALLVSSAVVAASAQRQPGTFKYVTTSLQTLADGTHITHTTHTVNIHDGYGRTRNEYEMQIPGRPVARSVNIIDPVAGVSYFYQEGEGQNVPHTYNRMEMHQNGQGAVQGSMSPLLTSPPPPSRTPQLSGLVVGAVASGSPAVIHSAPLSGVPGGVQEMRPEIKNEDLGFDTVQGVSCRSHRTTETYPVNFFGNDRPITVTREYCTAVENGGMMVRNVNDDPRSGLQTMLLESASFSEPAESLFQPPAGYSENVQNRPRPLQ